MVYDLGNMILIPLTNDFVGTWSRIQLYSPEMAEYRPFLYIDLDTAVITSLEEYFDAVKDSTQYITLEDFWQKNELATGLMWIPKENEKVRRIWKFFKKELGSRMDVYIRRTIGKPDLYWQTLIDSIVDFKPRNRQLVTELPAKVSIVSFHGKPRIFQAQYIPWIKQYVLKAFPVSNDNDYKVTVIIPYKEDRGWLGDAIGSVPKGVQLLVSQGEGNWPANFNKVWDQVKGKYVRWLHEDDMLTPNCIEDSLKAIEEQDVDFIHGNVVEITHNSCNEKMVIPRVFIPTAKDIMEKNCIHSASLMYKKEVFDKVGLLDERLNTAEEYEFNIRCLKAGMKIGYCNTPLAFYRRHFKQKVRQVSGYQRKRERELVIAKYDKD
jgi:hypothetical protein